jgi:hypothetical protein
LCANDFIFGSQAIVELENDNYFVGGCFFFAHKKSQIGQSGKNLQRKGTATARLFLALKKRFFAVVGQEPTGHFV